jgi:hypothetical protein
LLSLVTLAGIFGIEGIVVGLARAPIQLALIDAGVGALVVAWPLYRAAVGVTATMGLFVTSAFDFCRGAVLEKFGLRACENIVCVGSTTRPTYCPK